jgi:hypothetical protein
MKTIFLRLKNAWLALWGKPPVSAKTGTGGGGGGNPPEPL